MKMKRTISFLLVLVMLLGLFAGCGQQGGESQSGTESQAGQESMQTTELKTTELIDLAPPRIAEEFVPRLNAELKARDIPLEFVYQGEYPTQAQNEDGVWVDCFYGLYLAAFTDSGAPVTTEQFDLSVYYWSEPTEPMIKLQIWVADDATEREREMRKTVCAIAAQLCDEQITEETARELLATEPSDTPYVIYTGEIGSFTKEEASYLPMHTAVFWQGADLTHTAYRSLSSDEEWYEISFTQSGETLFGDRIISAPSVEELEQRINDALVKLEIPISCQLHPYQEYGRWKASFRFTTMDDPDYVYPEFDYDYYGTDVDPKVVEYDRRWRLDETNLTVEALDPVSKDAPIQSIDILNFSDGLPLLDQVLLLACNPEAGEEDYRQLQSLPYAEVEGASWDERVLEKDSYTITEEIHESGYRAYDIHYSNGQRWNVEPLKAEQLMDPALLEYEFLLYGPILKNGRFDPETGFETNFNGFSIYSDGSYYLDICALLNDYLECTRSGVSLEWMRFEDSESYQDYFIPHAGYEQYDESTRLDPNTFYISDLGYDADTSYEIYMCYNTNVEQRLTEDMDEITLENLLRVPIGLSLLMDEAMTAEEAIRMHTDTGAYDFVSGEQDRYVLPKGYETKVFASGELIHVLGEKPETGERWYSIICRDYVENSFFYMHLLQYLEP